MVDSTIDVASDVARIQLSLVVLKLWVISDFGIVRNIAEKHATPQKPIKQYYEIESGLSSAIKGDMIVAALQNTLQIPIHVAAILTGKNITQET